MIDKIIKIIQAQIIFDNLLTRLICCAFMILFIIYYLNRGKKQSFSIYDYRLNWWGDLLRIIFLYVILYCGIISYVRLSRVGYMLNLKLVYNKLKNFFIMGSISDILITVLFWSLVLCMLLLFLVTLKKLIKINLLKIHFYIISKYPMMEKTHYYYIQDILFKCDAFFIGIFRNMVRAFRKRLYEDFLNIPYDGLKRYPFEKFLGYLGEYNALIILIFLIVYDMIANDFIITKAYYFLPFVFFFSLLDLIVRIMHTYEPLHANIIACVLYIKEKEFREDATVYENNFVVSHENLYYLLIEITNKTKKSR